MLRLGNCARLITQPVHKTTVWFSGTEEYLALIQRVTDQVNNLPTTEINVIKPDEANNAMLMGSKGLSWLHPSHNYPRGRSFQLKGTILWIPNELGRSLKLSIFKLSSFTVCKKCGLLRILLAASIAAFAFGMLLAFLYSVYTKKALSQVFSTLLTQFM